MRIQPLAFVLFLALLALAAVFGTGLLAPTQAEESTRQIAYISVTGEGPTAKGWFRGAPPAGMMIQDALDHFAEQGYRVSRISPSLRPIVTIIVNDEEITRDSNSEHYYVILLER